MNGGAPGAVATARAWGAPGVWAVWAVWVVWIGRDLGDGGAMGEPVCFR